MTILYPVSAAARPPRLPERGRVCERSLDGGAKTDYFEYVPRRIDPGAPLLVSVHGISLNAREHAELFAPHAEQRGNVVVAPFFDPRRFPGFQRLARDRKALEEFLRRIVDDVRRRTGLKSSRFALFGFSGGGQFAHRYAMFHPRQVRSLIVTAPGWYTFPNVKRPYPLGLGPRSRYPNARRRLQLFLGIPIRVTVGERDTERDPSLNTSKKIDRQGQNRVERAQRWTEALARAARQRGIVPAVSLSILPDSGHSFRECVERGGLARLVFETLW